MGFPSFVNDLNSVPIEGVLSNEAYSRRFGVDSDGFALRVRLPTACFRESIVCVGVVVVVAVATGAIVSFVGRYWALVRRRGIPDMLMGIRLWMLDFVDVSQIVLMYVCLI